MDTKLSLENALKDAMRHHDDLRKRTIRMALAAVKFAEIDKGAALDEPALVAILHKEIKSRRESIADAQKANRPDLVSASEAEIIVLQEFLPQGLSTEELRSMVAAAIEETGAKTPADMGKVMKLVIPRAQGRAANDQISQVVRQLLQGS
jgi:uncharacterized protein YqeY